MLGKKDPVDDLHIQEAGVVHQDQAGFVLQALQPLDFIFEFGAGHSENRQDSDEATPKDVDLLGVFVLIPGDGQDFIIIHALDASLHRSTSFLFMNCSYYIGNPSNCQRKIMVVKLFEGCNKM